MAVFLSPTRRPSEERTTYLVTSFLELLPGYKKSTLTFSVMPHGLVHESKEKLRTHFLHTGTPSATGLVLKECDRLTNLERAPVLSRGRDQWRALCEHRRR